MRQKIIAFIKLSRAYFLTMPILPYLIGVGLARQERESLNMNRLWIGLFVQMLVQLSVSYLNDYWDIETDRINQNRTLFSGGSGELAHGIIPPYAALITGCILQGLALLMGLLLGIPLASWGVLLAAVVMTQIYTAPPIKLVYRGFGEFGAAVVAVLLVPSWGYSLQTDSLSPDLMLIGTALLPFIMGMLLGIAVPDYDADQQVGKNTLVVRVGLARLARLYISLISLGYLLIVVILPQYIPWLAVGGTFLSVPLVLLAWRGFQNPVKTTPLGWLWLVLCPGLATLVVVAAVTGGIWSDPL